MFGKLFGRGNATPPPAPEGPELSADERIRRMAIEDGRGQDPLIAARIGADDVRAWLMQATETERGVHVESLFVSLGALGGFACQLAARHSLTTVPHQWDHPWAIANGADGRTYYFGDAINHYLIEGHYSLWSLAAGILPQLGADPVPDVGPLVTHVAATVGGGEFGEIRYPEGTSAGDTPVNYVRHFWPPVADRLVRIGTVPDDWPPLFGLLAQELLTLAKDVIAPSVALTLIMESAIAMAKLDPAEVGIESPDPAG